MDLSGKTLGNYRIDRLLGEGSTGAVYQAHDLSLQRDVAIKLIHPHFARQPNFRERFQQEARGAVNTDYPGFVKVHDFVQQQDQLLIVMEYIRGANLRQLLDELIQERKWLPLREAVLLSEQLCHTLEYAHKHRMPHRDIKPANLMIKPEQVGELPFRVVLTDLGLVNLLEGQGFTQDGTLLGTPAYMSPEQAWGRETDPRSDVYSLGILLYELAVGLLPFPIKTITEAVHYHTKEQPPAPRSIRPDLPEALERVIQKALEKDPKQRYQSAAELGTALVEMIADYIKIAELDSGRDVSLLTKYEESLMVSLHNEPTGLLSDPDLGKTALKPSIVPGPAEISPKMSIEVLSKGKKPQMFPLQNETVTIGRDQDNQLVILDPEVSRRHAQVTWDGSNYYVTDLKSRNGTYLENRRLSPDTANIWRPHQELRMGGFTLHLIRHAQPESVVQDFGAKPVRISVTPQQLAVEPGGSVTATLSLLNQGPNADRFSLSITGIPNNWIAGLPSHVELTPGDLKETTFSLHVPRTPQSRAGRYPITLSVASRRDPTQSVELKLNLTVAVYSEFRAELQPQRLQAGQTGQLVITNQGNLQETFTVQFTDTAEELAFQPPQIQLRVPEGGSAIAEFQAQLRQTRWLGGEKSHAFSAKVSQPKEEPQTLYAEWISRGLIPIWVLPTVMLFCLLFTGSVAALWSNFRSAPTPTLTPVAPDTVIASKLLNGNTVTFTFNGTDSGIDAASFECKLDSGDFTTCTSPMSYPNLADGSHTFEVRAKDAAGNTDPSPESFTWTIDTTALDTTITNTPLNLSNNGLATFDFSGTDSGAVVATFECQLDSGSFTACTSPTSYPNLADGPHTFQVRAKDAAGNTDQFPASFSWTIDTTAPETTITNKASIPSNSNSVMFVFTRTDSGTDPVTFECQLDGEAFKACISPTSYSGLGNGSHTFQVRAKDAAGNTDQTPEKFTWNINVDTVLPLVRSITTTAQKPTNALSVNYTITFSKSVIGVDASDFRPIANGVSGATVGGVTGSGTTWNVSVNTGTGDGTIRLDLIDNDSIKDDAGNLLGGQGALNGDFITGESYTIDKTPPSVTINGPSGTVSGTNINFTVDFTEPVRDFVTGEVSLSGSANAKSAVVTGDANFKNYNVVVSGMTVDGQIIVRIPAGVATDSAGNGNTSSNEKSVNFQLSNNPPVVNPNTFNIDENSTSTNVGAVTYIDQDTGQIHSFSIQSGNIENAFAINSTTGLITVANSAALDYETHPTFNLTVRVTDNAATPLSGEAAITINLNDANEPPTNINLSATSVVENPQPNSVVGQLTTIDPDSDDTFTYNLINGGNECPGPDNSSFDINGNEGDELVTSASFNPDNKDSLIICVRTTDGGSLTFDKQFTITVTK